MIFFFLSISGSARMRQLFNKQVGYIDFYLKHVPFVFYLHVSSSRMFILIVVKHVFCFFSITENLMFRLRDELNRTNEQVEEYRHIIYLLNEKNLTTNIDDLNRIDYSDDDDSRPIEKNFCLDDNTENKFIFLYSKPPLPLDDDDIDNLSILSHLENEIE